MVGFAGKFTQISFADTMRRWCRMNNLQARTALCVDCTNGGFAFLSSQFPQLLANMNFALVQVLFRGKASWNLREFLLTALYGDGAGGTICKLVPLCALIAQTEGMRFRPPHSHSFLLICSLH